MERYFLSALLFMLVLNVATVYGQLYPDTVFCWQNQTFNGSCYEFVTQQLSFDDAEAVCESNGGHLAFIFNEETQQFLERHLQPDHKWWIGLASEYFSLSLPFFNESLIWLNGSELDYTNFVWNVGEGLFGNVCGFITNGSDFYWNVTSNCDQEFFFVCEFEFGHVLSCLDNTTVLRCDIGEEINITESFYGRNTVHYCKSNHSYFNTSVQDMCTWVNVTDVVADLCDGYEICEVPANSSLYGEPCPELGSYLSIRYHCNGSGGSSGSGGNSGPGSNSGSGSYSGSGSNSDSGSNSGSGANSSPSQGTSGSQQVNSNAPQSEPVECKCTDLKESNPGDVEIQCIENCGESDVKNNITLKLSPTITDVGWYYVQNNGPSLFVCGKEGSGGQIKLSKKLGNYSTFTVSRELMETLNTEITIVAEGTNNQELGYDCYTIKLPEENENSPNSGVTLAPTYTTALLTSKSTITFLTTTTPPYTTELLTTKSNITVLTTTTPPYTTELLTTKSNITVLPTPTPPYTTALPTPICHICPQEGYIYTPFTITCDRNSAFCCGYCSLHVKTSKGDYVYYGDQEVMPNLFFPQDTTGIKVIIKNAASEEISTTLQFHVKQTTDVPLEAVSQIVSLNYQGKIPVSIMAPIFRDIADSLGNNYTDDKQEMLEKMCESLCYATSQTNSVSIQDQVKTISSTVLSIVKHEDDLTRNIKKKALCVLDNLSLNKDAFLDGNADLANIALPSVLSASILLKHSANSDQEIAEALVRIMDQLETVLLITQMINAEPTIISSPLIHLYVRRVTPDNLHKSLITAGNSTAIFSLPPSVSRQIPADGTVNIRMVSYGVNPYAWNSETDISGTVGTLSLTKDDGSAIPVENLDEDIEILLPRLGAETSNKTLLNLTSYSTMIINVTAPKSSLVVKLKPLDATPLMLHLGYQYYPSDTKYVAKTQFSQIGNTQEVEYTWVLSQKDVAIEEGIYYLLVRPIVSAGVNSSNASVFITSIAANCKYWNDTVKRWHEDGCRVGPDTTPMLSQCLCTHLTAFGSSFFVSPNTVDVSRTAELFSTFVDNPVVVCFVGALFLAFLLAAIWAYWKDRQDKIKVRLTVLEDNDPLAEYRYLVAVKTGHRHGAATTSQVTLTLMGTVWESKPHHLTDPEKPLFTRGAVDLFLLTTPFSLGDLQSIWLWHDNSGEHPDWYVSKVMVQDLETGQMWHFLCNSWLSIDVGECTLNKVFHTATEQELKSFQNLFFTKTANDLCDGHLWYSVVNRPASSNFTRVQRVSCCFSLLLCTMLTSIMFWGIPQSPSEQDLELGTITFNLQQLKIGIQSSLIMFPVNLLIVTIFRKTRPRKKKPIAIMHETKSGSPMQEKKLAEKWRIGTGITVDIIVKDLKKIVRGLARAVKCPFPNAAEESEITDINSLLCILEDMLQNQNFTGSRFYAEDTEKDCFLVYKLYRHHVYKQLLNLDKQLRLLDVSKFPDGYYSQAFLKIQNMKQLLEPYLYSIPMRNVHITSPEEEKKKSCFQKRFPWWFVIVGWILILATSGVSAYFTMMYGLTYGKERSISWLISISVSFFESLLVTQPIKVLGFAIFFALVVKSVQSDDENYFRLLKNMKLTYSEDPADIRTSRRKSASHVYQPPLPSDAEKMKINYIKNQKALALIWEIIIYLAFLCVLLAATYGQRDPNAYYLTQHIQQRFNSGISDSMTHGDVFNWANNVLTNLYGKRPGFITDGNSKLVGSARLRQIRVHKDSCTISKFMQRDVHDCHAPYSWGIEDMGSYGPGWNNSRAVNTSNNDDLLIPWQYETQSKLRGHPFWGTMAFYRGGGYVLNLGLDPHEASSILQYLFMNKWLDRYTRAIFVEFMVYNANVNLFCIVTLVLETNAVGAFQYSNDIHTLRLYQTTDGINIVAAQVIYFLFILYYIFLQFKKIKQQRWQYFRSKFNLLELTIIFLSLAALGAIINRTIKGDQDLKYFQEHKDHFISFYDTASADASLGYILAFLILLGTIKMWHLMRLNSKLNLITCTLKRAWEDISSFIVVLIIIVLAYSILSNLLFGCILSTYKTLQDSILSIVSLQIGMFNYVEIINLSPVLGGFLILSCVIFLTFVVLNLFISVILEAFSHEQKHYKPSDEEEIFNLMVLKICKAFGIRIKMKK